MIRATATIAAGLGLGAGLMYYLDPDRGSRRRTHARNQMRHASHRLRDNTHVRSALDRVSQVGRMSQDRLGRVSQHRRLAWAGGGATRVAAALAGAAGFGLAARAAMNARGQQIELRS
jgi:hypothetical protein